MVDGKSREMSTKELFGGARTHYLFQSMFVKLLEEVDPCEKLADEDIAYGLRNSSGLRNVLFALRNFFGVIFSLIPIVTDLFCHF
ncbi:hypothetical protein HRI_001822300 [Hibiscus trionum]|uniref:Dynamin stalk domain-containing protein n=1 Tax=Hibiscus trionum TaxID=183268 RepID=A0A9W7M0F4_HIBTR|nr:hypothetical protein HRI_001822300 [Hibiscus trionum]